MKFTTSKKLDSSLLGERMIREYSYEGISSDSNDGRMRGYAHTVNCRVFSTIENETRNQDGTYTYEYSSRIADDSYGGGPRKPSESEYDLKEMVEELLFWYNIHEFSTDLQEEPNNIKDYFLEINADATYQKEKKLHFSYRGVQYIKAYQQQDQSYPYNVKRIRAESIDDVNEQLNGVFSKDNYIMYLMGYEIEKKYKIKLGLNDIGDNESVEDFLDKIELKTPRCSTLGSALNKNEISMEDIKNLIQNYENLSTEEISNALLEQLFSQDKDLITHFNERKIPIDILRKYSPNFDITKVSPKDLKPSDLDNVLDNVIQNYCISGFINGPSKDELQQGYLKYLQSFYDNPDALRKIIPVINTSETYYFTSQAKDFISKISPKVLDPNEIKDIILSTEDIELKKVLEYELDYDADSAKKLMHLLSNTTSKVYLENLNVALSIMKQNGLSNDEILQSLRLNGFNIGMSYDWKTNKEQIQKFRELGIEGITLDDLRDNILKKKEFNFLRLADDISPQDMTREYNSLLNELAEKKGKNDGNKRYEEVFELIYNYSNTSQLFSRLTPEVKELTKKLIIENLDLMEILQRNPMADSSGFSEVINVMTNSFDISQEDMINIYTKCLNNGGSKQEIIQTLQQYMPEEERKGFEERINSNNIYPNPKYFWLTDKNLKRIGVNWGDNRNTIKSKIQADGRCFSIRLKTDMIGESKEGKKIVVNNLSKWLFGVPGARGNLTITRSGDYIQLPSNTPDEAVELIQTVLMERENDEPSKD